METNGDTGTFGQAPSLPSPLKHTQRAFLPVIACGISYCPPPPEKDVMRCLIEINGANVCVLLGMEHLDSRMHVLCVISGISSLVKPLSSLMLYSGSD